MLMRNATGQLGALAQSRSECNRLIKPINNQLRGQAQTRGHRGGEPVSARIVLRSGL
jgi:hypothetical protein